MRFVYHCALRWSDLDAYGHVNNARFLTLYEEARVALMFVARARGRASTSFEEGVVIARHEVDYLRPVDYGDDRCTDRAVGRGDPAVAGSPSPTSSSTATCWPAGRAPSACRSTSVAAAPAPADRRRSGTSSSRGLDGQT